MVFPRYRSIDASHGSFCSDHYPRLYVHEIYTVKSLNNPALRFPKVGKYRGFAQVLACNFVP